VQCWVQTAEQSAPQQRSTLRQDISHTDFPRLGQQTHSTQPSWCQCGQILHSDRRPSTPSTNCALCLRHRQTDGQTLTDRQTDVTRVTSVVDTSLIAILKLHSNGPSYSAIQWLVHWPLIGGLLHLVQRGRDWASYGPAQAPPRCTKCNSPPINGQCTNHCIAIWWSVAVQFYCGNYG